MALAAARSKAVVLLLLICFGNSVIVVCFVVHYFVSILGLQSSRWGRESWLLCFALLCSFSWCFLIVVWLFLTMSRVCLQFVIVVFPIHSHYLNAFVNRADPDQAALVRAA